MSTAVAPLAIRQTSLARPILVGGAIAGALDLTSAFMTFGWPVPRAIAAALVGRQSFMNSSPLLWILGVLLHFTIAFSAAAIYCFAAAEAQQSMTDFQNGKRR